MMTYDAELMKTLFSLPSLSYSAIEKEIYISDKLQEVFMKRFLNDNTSYQGLSTITKLPTMYSYTPADLISVENYVSKHSDLWTLTDQYFTMGFSYDSLNHSGYVTWDCFDFYMLGKALMYSCGFEHMDKELLDEILDEEYAACETDWYGNEDDDEYEKDKEMILDDLLLLAKDCAQAVKTLKTENDKLDTFVDEMNLMLFNDALPRESFFENLEYLLHYIFGCCEGTNRSVYTITSKNIALYLKHKENVTESQEKYMIEQAIKVISLPLDEGWCGLPSITSFDEEDKKYTVAFFTGDNGTDKISIHHIKPFFVLAMRIIDELVPLVLKEHPSVDKTDGCSFFYAFLFAFF